MSIRENIKFVKEKYKEAASSDGRFRAFVIVSFAAIFSAIDMGITNAIAFICRKERCPACKKLFKKKELVDCMNHKVCSTCQKVIAMAFPAVSKIIDKIRESIHSQECQEHGEKGSDVVVPFHKLVH